MMTASSDARNCFKNKLHYYTELLSKTVVGYYA